ncbi:MAG: apolipoprotein N-acyltransferase [Gammaproteobacteria bacterium]|nr:apolipoprotein N-acyltransferase [Gammaproteobacteria bacterium]
MLIKSGKLSHTEDLLLQHYSKVFIGLIAVAAGMLTTLAYAPYSLWPLAFVGPAILLLLWQNASPKRALLTGLMYGIGLFGTGTWWIFISMHQFGHMETPLAILATILVVFYESLFPAVQGYLFSRWCKNASIFGPMIFFPSSWVLLEWLRSSLFTGWHWLVLGYTQIDSPLGGYAPIFGTYGISFLMMLTVGIFVWGLTTIFSKSEITPSMIKWRLLLKIIFIAVLWINGALLSMVSFTETNGKAITVSMIQGNIPQELKWQPDQLTNIVEKYHVETQRHWTSDLIIWPEGAIPALSTVAEPFLDSLAKDALKHHSSVMLGIPVAEGEYFYNAVLLIGESNGHYYKRHLVPFGEYVPLKKWVNPLLVSLNIPMSDFSSGPKHQPLLTVKNIPIATYVCYEIVEPDEVRRTLDNAELIVTITDDSWFDDSIASDQHLQMARMRSLENGLPQLFLSSRGESAIINSRGKITHSLPEHQEGVITATVSTVHGQTPWRKFGSYIILTLAFLAVLFSLLRSKRKS